MVGDKRLNPWMAAFLVLGGIGLGVAGVLWGREAKTFLDATDRTTGTVIELERERGARGMKLIYPRVRFALPNSAVSHTFRGKVGLWPSPFRVGDTVTVAYNPVDPEGAKIDSFWTIWLPPCVLLLFGLMCLAAGLHTLRGANTGQLSAAGS